jgi:hypothetical protein
MSTVRTEGTVQLSINELDNLRNQITTLTTQNNQLLDKQGQVKVSITVTEKYGSYDVVERGRSSYSGVRLLETVVNEKHRIIEQKEEYIKLEEIERKLYERAKETVQEELGTAIRKSDNLLREKEDLVTKHSKDISHIRKDYEDILNTKEENHKKQIKTLEDDNRTEIEKLSNIIKELQGETVDYTKDQIIAKLEQRIQELETKKGFWGFLHS